jgi:hypothetical protein
LVAKPQTPAPQEGARRVPVGRLVVVAIEDVRTPSVPFVCSLSASLLVCHGVPGGVDGVRPDTTGRAVSEACPIGVSIVDAGHDRADIGRGLGLRTFRHRAWGAGGHDGRVPMLVAAEVGRREHAHCCPVLSGQGQDVDAAWLAVAGLTGPRLVVHPL